MTLALFCTITYILYVKVFFDFDTYEINKSLNLKLHRSGTNRVQTRSVRNESANHNKMLIFVTFA